MACGVGGLGRDSGATQDPPRCRPSPHSFQSSNHMSADRRLGRVLCETQHSSLGMAGSRKGSTQPTYWFHGIAQLKRFPFHWLSAYPFSGVTRGLGPIGANLSACPGRCAAWSIKGVYSVSPRRRASTPLCLRGLWRNDALQTPISGLPEIGTQICASRVNPTCVDRYTHRLRDGPGPAVHRFAIARAAPHPGHV
jgi:hypothetical protein